MERRGWFLHTFPHVRAFPRSDRRSTAILFCFPCPIHLRNPRLGVLLPSPAPEALPPLAVTFVPVVSHCRSPP